MNTKRGRPKLPDGVKLSIQVGIRLAPADVAYLKKQYGGVSTGVRELVREARGK